MAQLEKITVGSRVKGISAKSTATIIAVQGNASVGLEVTFKDERGRLGSRLLYRSDEEQLEILEADSLWNFDADGNLFRLVSEAYRIKLAHIFDPYLAVHTSSIEPLPHQILAVYEEMLSRLPLRYILADDPGAGKTIMTGLFIKELIVRGDLKRCLIVTPGNLCEQWQDELYRKFHLRFDILTNDRIESAVSGNVFTEMNFCIARLDKLSRSESIQEKLKVTDWDLIVCDEAHKMSATLWGSEIKYTKRFNLGRLLSQISRNLLLLTATPHNGKEEDFRLFLTLVDADRFEGAARSQDKEIIDVSDIMRRLVKEDLLKFDGTPLFPERRAYTVNYDLSPMEAQLYRAVTDYVREEFNRADKLNNERKTTVGFALTILQRRLASSPEAIYQSLKRRRERMEATLAEEKSGVHSQDAKPEFEIPDDYDEDDYNASELEEAERKLADRASAASTISEMEAEIKTLKQLEETANKVRMSGEDRKWEELSGLLQDEKNMFGAEGSREKLIIFTEHRDTLRYLTGKIRNLLGNDEAVVVIHGGLRRDERRKVEEMFKQDKDVRILVATDAAGEGINLQRAHLMVNYDLPWNPNRLEQRFGRIHRIGQTEVCHLWNLVARETREGMVFQRLFEKLEEERAALGGKVFDILGKMTFDNKPLRDLLIEAVRYGNDPDVRARLRQVVDKSLDRDKLRNLLDERALTEDSMDIHRVLIIREDMERIEAHKLQPHFIKSFFIRAFGSLGGQIHPREAGRYEITNVPYAIRNRKLITGFGEAVTAKYERVCFDKENCNIPGQLPAALICPGHPLLDATIDLVLENSSELLKRGAVLIDDADYGTDARLLFYIEDSIQDGTERVISKNVHFVELKENGDALSAGYAPYLDYRGAAADEYEAVKAYIKTQTRLGQGVEERARQYAISDIIPRHFAEVKAHKEKLLNKISRAVKARMTAEIQYWDYRAGELKRKEAAGKQNAKLNSQLAARRAEELAARMEKRLSELETERMLSPLPPVIVGGALIIPKGLLYRLTGRARGISFGGADKKAVEYAAMNAVMNIERSLGFIPKDVSRENVGYDIESVVPPAKRDGCCLRFIEVKGRAAGAQTVTVSKNEILTGLNKQETFILAIVEINGNAAHTVYLRNPFRSAPDFTATSVNYSIAELIGNSEIIYKSDQ